MELGAWIRRTESRLGAKRSWTKQRLHTKFEIISSLVFLCYWFQWTNLAALVASFELLEGLRTHDNSRITLLLKRTMTSISHFVQHLQLAALAILRLLLHT